MNKITYAKWKEIFTQNLLSPDMPLVTVVDNTERLLSDLWQSGYPPRRAAIKFNARFTEATRKAGTAQP